MGRHCRPPDAAASVSRFAGLQPSWPPAVAAARLGRACRFSSNAGGALARWAPPAKAGSARGPDAARVSVRETRAARRNALDAPRRARVSSPVPSSTIQGRVMLNRTQVQQALDAGGGLLRLEPSWVPRSFMVPGRRLKLHPDDVYALGGHRGGINERWFSSTTNADNGPGTPQDEGLSYVRLATAPLPAQGRGRPGRRPAARQGRHGAGEGLEPALQVLRQPRRHPAPHAPERRAGQAARPQGQARGLLLPAAIQRDLQQLPVHLHGPRAGDDESRRPASASRTGTAATTASPSCRAPTASSPAPAGRSTRASCTRPGRSSPTSRR